MEQLIYRIALFVTGIINLLMAGKLLVGSKPYRQYAVYFRTRMLTALWVGVFGLGYILHGILMWRYTWPAAASALTVTYFHIGACHLFQLGIYVAAEPELPDTSHHAERWYLLPRLPVALLDGGFAVERASHLHHVVLLPVFCIRSMGRIQVLQDLQPGEYPTVAPLVW